MRAEPVQPLPPSPAPAAVAASAKPPPGGFVNSLGMRFAPVGNVLFSVWVTRVQDFSEFVKATGFSSSAWKDPGFEQAPDHPVVYVSWDDAMAFCKWLTQKEQKAGLLKPRQAYRLPTDLEWSRGVGLPEESGATPEARDMDVPSVFPWGTQWPPPSKAGNYTGEETNSDVAIKGYNDGFVYTSPVTAFPPDIERPLRYGRQRLPVVHGLLELRAEGEGAARRLLVQWSTAPEPALLLPRPRAARDEHG